MFLWNASQKHRDELWCMTGTRRNIRIVLEILKCAPGRDGRPSTCISWQVWRRIRRDTGRNAIFRTIHAAKLEQKHLPPFQYRTIFTSSKWKLRSLMSATGWELSVCYLADHHLIHSPRESMSWCSLCQNLGALASESLSARQIDLNTETEIC